MKISFELKGKLGNLMFQIAALETYCRKHGYEPVYVHSTESIKYQNNIFGNIKFSLNYPENYKIANWDDFKYVEIPKSNCNALISGNGYFQSEKYFDPDIVRELFGIKEDTKQKILLLYPEISKYVSLHVRRGDYLQYPNHHPLCSLYYYESAMELFPNKTFLVFSDDIDWCKQNLKKDNLIFVENNLLDYEELHAMSLCSDNIIANSTFSWWGAYLNQNPNKKNVAPNKWFGPKGPAEHNIVPDSWITLGSSTNYVLIYLGQVPPHVSDCIDQIYKTDPEANIFFCGNQNYSHKYIKYVPVHDLLNEDKVGNFMDKYRSNPLWKTSLLRVFILNEFLKKFKIPVIHLDTDVLIYKPFRDIRKYVHTYNYITPGSNRTCSTENTKNFSYCVINNISLFHKTVDLIENTIKNNSLQVLENRFGNMVNEMSLLANLSGDLLKDLPVIPGNDFDGIIFDAGSYSFYLDGMDSRYYKDNRSKPGTITPGYIIAAYLLSLKGNFKIEFNSLEGPSLTVDDKKYSIMCLHMHSKNLKKFISKPMIKLNTEKIFENTLYINLDSRTDRNQSALRQFEKMGITATRVSAVDSNDLPNHLRFGYIACSLSHLKSLFIAKERNWDYVCICEDDVEFTNPELLKTNLQKFLENPNSPDWDVLLLGANLIPSKGNIKLNDYSIKVAKGYSAVCYVIKKDYYDKLIENIQESIAQLKINPSLQGQYALDVHWGKLQERDTFIMIIPPTVNQISSYSNIEKKNTDYSSSMLNIEKGFL